MKKILTEELQSCEAKYGFTQAPTYWKVLSAETFGQFSQMGALFKDVGAGFQHGDFTHRIQWYVALFHLTNGFSSNPNLANSPSQLLTKINTQKHQVLKKGDWPSNQQSGFGGLWDAVFDRNNQPETGNPKHGYNPKTDGITSPEAFNARLLKLDTEQIDKYSVKVNLGNVGDLSDQYPILSAVLTKRFLKRHRNLKADNEAMKEGTLLSTETTMTSYRDKKLKKDTHYESSKDSGVLIRK